MKKQEVKVGTTYRVKVSGSVQDVRITAENPHGGWDGLNIATNRKVRVKSAQRLRAIAAKRPAKRKTIMSLAEYEAEGKTGKKDQPKANVGPKAKKPAKATTKATVATGGDTGERGAKGGKKRGGTTKANKADKKKRPSGLDAAATVLADADEPLNTKTMVERMLAKGLWQTGGKTPAATIYAAIIREIAVKVLDARFRKVDRGHFELAKGA